MKLGIFGAGAIGSYVGGRLIAAGTPVVLVGRPSLAAEVQLHGLHLTDYRGVSLELRPDAVTVATNAEALADCDIVIVTVKGRDSAEAAKTLGAVLPRTAVIISLQNGVVNAARLRASGRRVVPAMVPFNVLRREGGSFHQGTSGVLALGADAPTELVRALVAAGLPAKARADIDAVLWGKLLYNLSNAINALANIPIRQMLADRAYRRCIAASIAEAVQVMTAAGITPRLDPPLPAWLLPRILSQPDAVFRLIARPMLQVDPLARSSMWDDLSRKRPTEVDDLNGEIVRLGETVGLKTPIHRAIVGWVHAAETTGTPGWTAAEFTERFAALAS